MSSERETRIEVISSVQRRRRWSAAEKLDLVKRSLEPGKTVSFVAREAGVAASQLFQWRKAYVEGGLVAVGSNEQVVPASELQEAVKRIKLLEAALGRKTLENEILKEAVDFAKSKKWIARSPLLPGDDQ
jgi:transposase